MYNDRHFEGIQGLTGTDCNPVRESIRQYVCLPPFPVHCTLGIDDGDRDGMRLNDRGKLSGLRLATSIIVSGNLPLQM